MDDVPATVVLLTLTSFAYYLHDCLWFRDARFKQRSQSAALGCSKGKNPSGIYSIYLMSRLKLKYNIANSGSCVKPVTFYSLHFFLYVIDTFAEFRSQTQLTNYIFISCQP